MIDRQTSYSRTVYVKPPLTEKDLDQYQKNFLQMQQCLMQQLNTMQETQQMIDQQKVVEVSLDEDQLGIRKMCKDAVERTMRDANDFGDFNDIQEFVGTLDSLADPVVKCEVKDAMQIA